MAERTAAELAALLAALANPLRLEIVAALVGGTTYVSQLARDLGISRPLLNMHLQKLEAAGVVTSQLELSDDGKAMRYFAVTDFEQLLDASTVARAVRRAGKPQRRDGARGARQ